MSRPVTPNIVSGFGTGIVELKLTQGQWALLAEQDYYKIKMYRWYAGYHGRTFYAQTQVTIQGRRKTVRMQQLLLPCPSGFTIDHIDGDGLNNLKNNLRLATQMQNCHNRIARLHNVSGYRGVWWSISHKSWIAYIGINGSRKHLGYFKSVGEAIKVRTHAENVYFGAFNRKT